MSELKVIETFKNALQNYSLEQLRYKSADGVWSICQMYDHLILVALEYLENVEACAVSKEEQKLGKSEFGGNLFKNGGFPPIKIRLPDELNAPPNNSDCNEVLLTRLEQVEKKMQYWQSTVDQINPNYKVKHGGFGWLNAREWFDLVDMHFRHHLRQKSELEDRIAFLRT
ncbi:DinB family protein [Bacillus sp. JJ664]